MEERDTGRLVLCSQWDEIEGLFTVRTATDKAALEITGKTEVKFAENAMSFAFYHGYAGVIFREPENPEQYLGAPHARAA